MKTVIKKVENFTTVHNELLSNDKLSWKAKGILIYMLSKPSDWTYNIKGDIAKRSTDKENSVYSGVQELIERGYVSRLKNRDGTVDYYIFEDRVKNNIKDFMIAKPCEMPDRENPDQEKPNLENPDQENRDVLIRKNTTKERIIVILNTSKELEESFKDFKKMRTKMKRPMTEKAELMLLNKLMKLSKQDIDLAIEIIEQSVYHCWLDVYALKEQSTGNKSKNQNYAPLTEGDLH